MNYDKWIASQSITINTTSVGDWQVSALYGRLICGWLRVVCSWSTHTTVGSGRGWLGMVVARQADLSGRLGATGGECQLRGILVCINPLQHVWHQCFLWQYVLARHTGTFYTLQTNFVKVCSKNAASANIDHVYRHLFVSRKSTEWHRGDSTGLMIDRSLTGSTRWFNSWLFHFHSVTRGKSFTHLSVKRTTHNGGEKLVNVSQKRRHHALTHDVAKC